RLARVLEQHGELVAAESREGVAGPAGVLEALRDLLEELIAGVVAERVVDLLEAVEVDQQHGERVRRALGPRERLVEPVAEERAVREPGQPVVEGLPRE